MLIIWTAASTDVITKILAPVLRGSGCDHKFLPLSESLPVIGDGDVLVSCGDKALKYLGSQKIVPSNRTVTSMRGKPHPYGSGTVFFTFDPKVCDLDYSKKPEIQWDLTLAMRLVLTGSVMPQIGDYKYVEDFSKIVAYVKKQYASTGKAVPLSPDLETISTNEWNPEAYIVSLSFTVKHGQAHVKYFEGVHDQPKKDTVLWQQINWLLTTPMVAIRGANFKFDCRWILKKWGISITNFKMDTTLVGSLLDENRSNSLNIHAKVYTTMGGYDDCVGPDTLVCTWDLKWVPIKYVKPGDRLLGFDEDIDPKRRRVLRVSLAESTKRVTKPGYRVTLSNGKVIFCSDNHGFLAHEYYGNGPFKWIHAKDLKNGVRIQAPIDVELPLDTRSSGYIAGLYDGEGYVSSSGAGMVSGISQKPGIVWDTYVKILTEHGLGGFYSSTKNIDGVMTSKHAGAATLKMLQLFRPELLISKIPYEGKTIPSGTEKVWVVSSVPLGYGIECVSLQTSTHTFVTEGICSHNSFNQKYDKSRMDLVPKHDILTYAGGDTDATFRVAEKLKSELLLDKKLANFYVHLLHPASRAFEDMEMEGCLIDKDYFLHPTPEYETKINKNGKEEKVLVRGLRAEVVKAIQEAEVAAFKDFPKAIKDENKEPGMLTLTRAKVISDFMFTPKGLNLKPKVLTTGGKTKDPAKQVASTAIKHMLMFSDDPKAKVFIDCLKSFNSAKKTLSTFIDGFLTHLRPDNRFHCSYILFKGQYGDDDDSEGGTNTGRTAAKDPAVQCLKGDSLVLTDNGYKTIQSIVEGYESGKSYKVLTHTGRWKPVIGVYRNGVKKVFTCSSEHGSILVSTGNHPYLTKRGWVRTDQLKVGDICYELRPSYKKLHQPNVLQLGSNEEQVHQPDQQGLDEIRWSWDKAISRLVQVRELPQGHGGEALERLVNREEGCNPGLYPRELLLGYSKDASIESYKHKTDHLSWCNQNRSSVGVGCGYISGTVALSALYRDTHGCSLDEGDDISCRLFQEVELTSIVPSGECETFDLTIEGSHSFVANGLVVHNTIPKHTYWAKKLRKGYIAPPGYVIVNWDYSQGELRIAACLANEKNMIQLYREGIDLHMITGGRLNGFSKEDMLAMKEEAKTNEKVSELFKRLRQGGKAGNFGLIYGMSAEGYMNYARDTYGVIITLEEATKQRNAFFAAYPGLAEWHKTYKNMAHLQGAVRSPLGRVRHLPHIKSRDNYIRSTAERQAINAPVQCTLSDCSQLAMAEFKSTYGQPEGCRPFMMCHDATTAYVKEEETGIWIPRVASIMENLPLYKFGWKPQVLLEVEAEMGYNLAELSEVDRCW